MRELNKRIYGYNKKFKLKSENDYLETLDELAPNQFKVLDGNYVRRSSIYKFKCLHCEYEFSKSLYNMLRSPNCPCCQYRKLSDKDYSELINKISNGDFELVGPTFYKNSDRRFPVRHKKCGFEFDAYKQQFLSKPYCPRCSQKLNKSREEVVEDLKNIENGRYILIGDYANTHTYMEVKHLDCNRTFNTKYYRFFSNGNRCPYCFKFGMSYMNEYISKYMDKIGIKYEREVTIDEIKLINKLPYDFYLIDYDLYLEYDGLQHFDPNSFYTDDFDKSREKDYIKNSISNLIRIPYDCSVKEVDEILDCIRDGEFENINNKCLLNWYTNDDYYTRLNENYFKNPNSLT